MQLLPISGKRCSASGPSRLKKIYVIIICIYAYSELEFKMSSGSTCAVSGCYNNSKKLKDLKKIICFEHQKIRDECPCPAPYALHCMPTKEERKQAWLVALKLKNPPKKVYVCSFHFVDKKPTELHPDPELYLGHNQQGKRKLILEANGSGMFTELVHFIYMFIRHKTMMYETVTVLLLVLSLLFVDGVRTSNVVSVTFRSACRDGQITVVCDYTTSFYFIFY